MTRMTTEPADRQFCGVEVGRLPDSKGSGPANLLNSLPETCRSSWAAIPLLFAYTGSRPIGDTHTYELIGERLSAAATPTRSASAVPRQINALRLPAHTTDR